MGVKYSELPEATSVASDDYVAFLDVSDNTLKRSTAGNLGTGIEITQEAYDLLPEEEKNNGTYYITDASSSGIVIDSELSSTSTNPVQNQVITNALSGLTDDKANKVESATTGNIASLTSTGDLADSSLSSDMTTTATSGNPISISGLKSNQLAINPVITFEPIQAGSGTPSPSNVRAISGYDKIEVLSCGVNVWDEVWELGELNAQGQNASSTTKIRSKNYIPVVGGSTYYLKLSSASAQVYICFYDVNKTFISSNTPYQGTFTVPLMARYCRFNCPATYGTTYNNDMGINYPATQTSYVVSNKATSISESLGQTVYGGSLDVRTGKLTVTSMKEVIDNNTTVLSSNFSSTGVIQYLKNEMKQNAQIISDKLSSNTSDSLYVRSYYENTNRILIAGVKSVLGITNATEWVTYLSSNPITICYELATPITIQLTPHEISLLKDYAYVSTNGTNIALDYHNGELASLADINQLGETVNKLGDNIKNVRELFTYTFNGTTTWQSALYDISQKLKLLSLADMRRLQLQYDTDNRIFNIVKIGTSNWQFSVTCLDDTDYIDTFVAILNAINLSENKFVMIRVQSNSSVTYTPGTTATPSNGTVIKVLLT